MNVVIFADHFLPGFRAGGPVQSLKGIVESEPHRVCIVARNHDHGMRTPYPDVPVGVWTPVENAQALYLDAKPLRWIGLLLDLRRCPFDVLYINSLQSPVYSLLPLAVIRLGLLHPRVVLVAPRGECSEGAQGLKRLKKRLARPLIRWLNRPRRVWHVSSRNEAEDLVRWWGKPLPGGHEVLVKGDPPPEPGGLTDTRFDAIRRQNLPTVLFASRIDPMKGLLEAIAAVGTISVPCRFLIFGSISSEAYWRRCRTALGELPASVHVEVGGAFEPSELVALVKSADVFILPTRGENFGHAIAGALANGCPVVVSDRTIWSSVAREGGGTATDDTDEMASSLDRICRLDDEERADLRVMTAGAYRRWYEANQDDTSLFNTAMSLGQADDH